MKTKSNKIILLIFVIIAVCGYLNINSSPLTSSHKTAQCHLSNVPEPFVLYENNELVALYKPPQYIVNVGGPYGCLDKLKVGNLYLQKWISENFNFETSNDCYHQYGLIHRLDPPTSGVILVAKTKKYWTLARERFFNQHQLIKKYIALAHGRIEACARMIIEPILCRHSNDWLMVHCKIVKPPMGRIALTQYKVLNYYYSSQLNEWFTLLDVRIITGVTHQIRVHLSSIGHPLVSDEEYISDKKLLEKDLKFCPRLFLHAHELSFPNGHQYVRIVSPLPEDLKNALSKLMPVKSLVCQPAKAEPH